MKKAKVTVLEKEFELFWSAQAMSEISEKSGSISKLSDWITGDNEDDTAGMLTRFSEVLEILINAAIIRDNYAIAAGFKQGEPARTFEKGTLAKLIGINEMTEMKAAIYDALSEDTAYEVPENAKVEHKEIDETLEEIKEARRKKEESGE